MKQLFKKIKSTKFIKYSGPNQEPPEHYDGKMRIHTLLGRQGYILLSNTDKFEFALPTIKSVLDGDKNYIIDVLMYNPKKQRLVSVEINGAYHFKNKEQIGKTKNKHKNIVEYLELNNYIEYDKEKYRYKAFLSTGFKTEEVIGKYALSDDEITNILV